jgi:signal transduction histidine kinase
MCIRDSTLDDAINEARGISYNLMPRTLKDYGLVLALEQLATRMTKSSGVQVTLYHHKTERLKLPENIELDLFRIAQEAVNNALKYAQATAISVQLIRNEKYITLTVEDNGQGFDLKEKEQESSGLTNIRMRTEMLGGYATIESNPGSGTIVSVEIPVQAAGS